LRREAPVSDWTLVAEPIRPHARLEALARRVWDRVTHGLAWPSGWRVVWGELRPEWWGLCDYGARTIIVSEKTVAREVGKTVAHEVAHVASPTSAHGVAFKVLEKRATDSLEEDSIMMDRDEIATLRRGPSGYLAAMESLEAHRRRGRGSLDAAWARHLRAGIELAAELAGRPALATLRARLERACADDAV